MGGFAVNFLYLKINFTKILGKLVLSSLDIGVDFLNLGRDISICILKSDQLMLPHLP